jgi:3-isopropylmalate/(R)-2-methylmalate dehydratase large subunit
MTVCNMSIEMGARGGMVAPDETTFNYIKGREKAPKGEAWDKALAYWKTLYSDEGASFDKVLSFDATEIEPMITYGTNPGMGMGITQHIPLIAKQQETERKSFKQALDYMALQEGTSLLDKPVDYVFIGSCTNSRMEDLRMVAAFVKGKKKADNVEVWVVPGSKQVEKQAREEGIHEVFAAAGFQLRGPGCSACLGMNEDKIPAGKYCISTSNRNFEGRQGPSARTFLASPLTAAAAAISGRIADVRELI